MYKTTYFGVFCIFVLVKLCPEVSCDYCVDFDHFVLTNTNEKTIQQSWFTNCQGGSFFNLSHNKIIEIKNTSFNILWNIEVLDISFNEISSIDPGAFFGMRRLQKLYMSNNQISKLPEDFFDNKNFLIVVDLSYNLFTDIPLTVFNYSMSELREVILHHNLLTAFEPWAYFKQGIQYFDLRWNNISTFTNDYNWTYTYRSVYDEALTDLRYNNIREWHDWYVQQYKDPNGKQIGVEAVMVEILTDLRENPIFCDCNVHNLVTRTQQSFYHWSNSEYLKLTCYDPPELRGKLTVFEVKNTAFVCNISQDCPSGCLCQDRPEDRVLNVDCRGIGLTRIPQTVPRSPYNNITLQLDNNMISTFDNVSYIPQITSISMANNPLTSIPDFVMHEIASKDKPMVDFRNNSLTSLPSSLRNIKYQNAFFQGNPLKCSCEQLWTAKWIADGAAYTDKSLTCEFEDKLYKITELNESILKCNPVGSVVLITVLCVVLVIVIALLVTAKRCPYETKVLLFKIFRIHPSDRYQVDKTTGKSYDMYVSFDDDDPYVRQWVMKVLFKQLENKKPFYRLCVAARNAPAGPEADGRLQLIEDSRRLLIILSEDYERHKWCEYEMCHSETLEQNQGRILYLLYDKTAEENAKREPWLSKMKDRKVFRLEERMLWSKLRYEMPRKPVHKKQLTRERPMEYTDLNFN